MPGETKANVLRAGIEIRDAQAAGKKLKALLNEIADAAGRAEGRERDLNAANSKLARGFGFLKKAAVAVGGAVALREAVRGTARLVALGAAAGETRSKFETVLGPAVQEADQFLGAFANKAGLTVVQGQELLATTAAMAQGFGFAQEESGGFAQEVVRLAGDLGSFNNLPTADVLRSIQSGLAGERESLKRLGIIINQQEVDQRALNQTRKESVDLLTQQEKATATLALITERAGVAVGDLDRTQDSLANRLKQSKAAVGDILNTLGGFAAEALTSSNAVGEFKNTLFEIKEVIEANEETIKTVFIGVFKAARVTVELLSKSITGLTVGIGKLAELEEKVTDFLGGDSLHEIGFNLGKKLFGPEDVELAEREQAAIRGATILLENAETLRAQGKAHAEEMAEAAEEAADAEERALRAAQERQEAMEAATAQSERASAFATLFAEGYVTAEEALRELADAERRLERIAENTAQSTIRRAEAAERAADAAKAQFDILDRIARGAGLEGVGGEFEAEASTRLRTEIDIPIIDIEEANKRWERSRELYRELTASTTDWNAVITQSISGIAALADGLGLLEGRARDALRGVSDIVSGISSIRGIASEGGGFGKVLSSAGGIASLLPGAGSIIGGVAGLVGGLFGGDGRKEALERERNEILKRNNDRVAELTDALRESARTASETTELGDVARRLAEALGSGEASQGLFAGILGKTPEDFLEGIGISIEELEKLADDLGITIRDSAGKIIPDALRDLQEAAAATAAKIEQAEGRFLKQLDLRELEAKGLDAEAQALRNRIDLERQLAAAEKQGFSDAAKARLQEVIAAEQAAEAIERANQARAERASFLARLEAGEARLRGDFREATSIEFQDALREELNAANELLEAGRITREEFERFKDFLQGEFAQAQERTLALARERLSIRRLEAQGLEDEAAAARLRLEQQEEIRNAIAEGLPESFIDDLRAVQETELANFLEELADASERAAQAIAAQNRRAEEDLELRGLLAEGMDREAALRRQEVEARREIEAAIEADRSDAFLEELRRVQALERRNLLDDLAERAREEEERDRDVRTAGASTTTVSFASGATRSQATVLISLTRSQLSVLRSIEVLLARNLGGGRLANTDRQVGGSARRIDETIASRLTGAEAFAGLAAGQRTGD